MKAPSKKLIWFEESGYEPFVDEAAKFNAAMVELVRPVVAGELQPDNSIGECAKQDLNLRLPASSRV